jgi:GNAT superfamily N-acetyltransferase
MLNLKTTGIRQAEIADAPQIAMLCGQLGYPTTSEQAALRLGSLLSNPDHSIFIAEAPEGKIAGWLHVFIMRHLEMETVAEISGLVVDEAFRGQGIGKVLVEAAKTWASVQNVTILRVHSNAIRLQAHHFYEDLGFERQKTQHVFTISLSA